MNVPQTKFFIRLSYIAFFIMGCILLYVAWVFIAINFPGNKLDKESHFLPLGYIGDVHIFFNEKDGLKKETIDNRRIYRVQKSGILKTQFKKNLGVTSNINEDLKFYYIGNGKEIELQLITKIQDEERLDSNTIVVFGYGYKTGYGNITGRMGFVLTYSIDSLKNIKKIHPNITLSNYENWKD